MKEIKRRLTAVYFYSLTVVVSFMSELIKKQKPNRAKTQKE